MKATQTTVETWLPVVGREDAYEVSDQGRVRNIRTGRILRGSVGSGNYRSVSQGPGGPIRIHTLVTAAFIGPKPPGMEVCHGDGDPLNNALSNLRYGTRSDNIRDAIKHGTHYTASRTHCPQGHPYDEANTYLYQGRRYCRACHKKYSADFWRKKKAGRSA